jgi:hypothetical protein
LEACNRCRSTFCRWSNHRRPCLRTLGYAVDPPATAIGELALPFLYGCKRAPRVGGLDAPEDVSHLGGRNQASGSLHCAGEPVHVQCRNTHHRGERAISIPARNRGLRGCPAGTTALTVMTSVSKRHRCKQQETNLKQVRNRQETQRQSPWRVGTLYPSGLIVDKEYCVEGVT